MSRLSLNAGLLVFFYACVLANIAGAAIAYVDGHLDLLPVAFGALFINATAMFLTGWRGLSARRQGPA